MCVPVEKAGDFESVRTMLHISYSNMSEHLGINPLTGEACALSMRMLCDLNEKGAALMREYWGLPYATKFAEPMNSKVHIYDSVASVMIDREAFAALMRFAMFRAGHQYMYGNEQNYTVFDDTDLVEYPSLAECVNGNTPSWLTGRLYRNQRIKAPQVDTRNVHQFTGRAI